MYRVLLPVDEDEERASRAAAAASNLPCADEAVEVVLLNVFEEFEVADGEWESISSEDVWNEHSYPDSVDAVEERLEAAGVSVTRRREHGDPAEEISAVAEEIDADNVVMGGQRRSPAGKALFGSVTQSVLLDADRPVTVILDE
ncbi:universal stress protein [Halomicrobium salinisoli]|uniref:universal stress protein n=1 Tax=Halomicrobium salinisoli TaxID=2878391 RepID=UPI001CF06A85|nr:universal stress protein [Halomicrobium salinisoli]